MYCSKRPARGFATVLTVRVKTLNTKAICASAHRQVQPGTACKQLARVSAQLALGASATSPLQMCRGQRRSLGQPVSCRNPRASSCERRDLREVAPPKIAGRLRKPERWSTCLADFLLAGRNPLWCPKYRQALAIQHARPGYQKYFGDTPDAETWRTAAAAAVIATVYACKAHARQLRS